MGTILIDKLLSACVKQGASDLHITVGQPPVLRIHGQFRHLAADKPNRAEMETVVDEIVPANCREQLRQTRSTTFQFGFGELARVRAFVDAARGNFAVRLQLS
jgi:twitching motility protein PilT